MATLSLPRRIRLSYASVASRAAALRGAVLVNWLQDLFPEVASVLTPGLLPAPLERLLIAARNRSLRRAALNVVLGEGMRDRVLSAGIDAARVRIVPNWSDTTSVVPQPTASTAPPGDAWGSKWAVSSWVIRVTSGVLTSSKPSSARPACCVRAPVRRLSSRAAVRRPTLYALPFAPQSLESFFFQSYQPAELLSDSLAAAMMCTS